VTSIELEHTDKLGDSLDAIAREKAGILKPGVPAVVGALPEPARAAVADRVHELGIEAAWLGRDFDFEIREATPEGLSLTLHDGPVTVDVRLPVLGAHQAANASLALACVRRAGVMADSDLAVIAARGLAQAELPGRVEVLGRSPCLIVDAAHTAASARALAQVLAVLPRRRTHLVLSISAGKDIDAILAALLPHADSVTVTRAEPARSLSPAAIAKAVRATSPGLELRVVPNPHLAVRAARAEVGADDLLCVTGSIYLAGIARSILHPRIPDGDAAPPPLDPQVARGKP
jgi:dihydrofolate synthase/folylpolyglutamate synthase